MKTQPPPQQYTHHNNTHPQCDYHDNTILDNNKTPSEWMNPMTANWALQWPNEEVDSDKDDGEKDKKEGKEEG